MQKHDRSEWEKWVRRWRRSGMSARTFAAKIGVNANTLMSWGARFAREGVIDGHRQNATAKRVTAKAPPVPRLVESEPLSLFEVQANVEETRFEVGLPGGRRVLVPQRFDSDALSQLLSVLS